MIRVPKDFEIFGNRIVVKGKKNLTSEDGTECLGLCNVDQLTIKLDTSLRGAHKWTVFCHEATHMALSLLGYDELGEDEVFVDRIGQVIYQMLKTARFHATPKSSPLSSDSPDD